MSPVWRRARPDRAWPLGSIPMQVVNPSVSCAATAQGRGTIWADPASGAETPSIDFGLIGLFVDPASGAAATPSPDFGLSGLCDRPVSALPGLLGAGPPAGIPGAEGTPE